MSIINTNDIKQVIQIIDVVASRGAIRGEEMKLVGDLREKLKLASIQQTEESEVSEQLLEG